MRPKPDPDPELMSGLKKRQWNPFPRSIGRLMTVVALSGLALAAYSGRTRPTIINPVTRQVFAQPSPTRPSPMLPRVQPAQPRDPAVIVAPAGIDEAMIVTARGGIDEAMIINPSRLQRQTITILPSPTPNRQAPAPIVPWQFKP